MCMYHKCFSFSLSYYSSLKHSVKKNLKNKQTNDKPKTLFSNFGVFRGKEEVVNMEFFW